MSSGSPGVKEHNNHAEDTPAGHCHPEIPVFEKASHEPGPGSLHINPKTEMEKVNHLEGKIEPNAKAMNTGLAFGREMA